MRLAVFDLDYTIWQPEMYQLSSAPKLTSVDDFVNKRGKGGLAPAMLKESRTKTDGMVLADKHNSLMRVLTDVSFICHLKEGLLSRLGLLTILLFLPIIFAGLLHYRISIE
jgi:hypothetical protein